MQTTTKTSIPVINSDQLLQHWQGHRRLTRKVIEAFPEQELFNYSVGGMRPFAHLIFEICDLTEGGVAGAATGRWKPMTEWSHTTGKAPQTKKDLLQWWDNITAQMNEQWPQITQERFAEVEKAFGVYEGPICDSLLYFIDNEIHHRGQGYVYLRSLSIKPPAFWDR